MKELNKKQENVILEFFKFGELNNLKKWNYENIKHFVKFCNYQFSEIEVSECILEIKNLFPYYGFVLCDNKNQMKVSKNQTKEYK